MTVINKSVFCRNLDNARLLGHPVYMDRQQRSVAIMIEVTSRQVDCTHFNSDYSQVPAFALQ